MTFAVHISDKLSIISIPALSWLLQCYLRVLWLDNVIVNVHRTYKLFTNNNISLHRWSSHNRFHLDLIFLKKKFIYIKQIYKKSYLHHTYYYTIDKKAENKDKKKLETLKEGKEISGVATMSFNLFKLFSLYTCYVIDKMNNL